MQPRSSSGQRIIIYPCAINKFFTLLLPPALAATTLFFSACTKAMPEPAPAAMAPAGFTNQYTYGYTFFDKLWLIAAVRTLSNVHAPDPAKLARIGLGEGVAYSAASLGASYAITKRLSATADVAAGFGKLRNVYSGLQSTFGVAVEW